MRVLRAAKVPGRRRARPRGAGRWLVLPLLVPLLAVALSWLYRVAATTEPAAAVEWVVQPGDTLWSIAEAHALPGEDIRAALWEIRQLNGLESSHIVPGQVIRIPAHRAQAHRAQR